MRTVLPLIDAIYEAVLDTDKWSAMLEQVANYFAARGARRAARRSATPTLSTRGCLSASCTAMTGARITSSAMNLS